jgi:hypothetical protein
MPRTFIILLLSVPMLLANLATAQDELSDTGRLYSKISELEQRITEMQKKHDEQINVLGWAIGFTACMIGLFSSYSFDLPYGPSLVLSLGFFFAVAVVIRCLFSCNRSVGMKG